jgi:hypothetical protein
MTATCWHSVPDQGPQSNASTPAALVAYAVVPRKENNTVTAMALQFQFAVLCCIPSALVRIRREMMYGSPHKPLSCKSSGNFILSKCG